jgi:hypothetical protein
MAIPERFAVRRGGISRSRAGLQWVGLPFAMLGAGVLVDTSGAYTFAATLGLGFMALVWTRPKTAVGVGLVVALLDKTVQQATGSSALGSSDEAITLILVVTILFKAKLLGRPIRWLPGNLWFVLYLCIGLVSSFIAGASVLYSVEDAFLILKGLLFGFAVAQIDWKTADIKKAVTYATWVLIVMLATTVLNVLLPEPWTHEFALPGAVSVRFGFSSLIGPFVHPASLGHVMALAAIAIVAYRTTLGRSSGSMVLLVASALASVLSLRRKSFVGLLAGSIGARLSFLQGRVRTVIVLALVLPAAAFILWEGIETVYTKTYTEYVNTSTPAARDILYRDSVRLADAHFPFGVGLGRYGSDIAGVHYSPIYQQLGYGHVNGLQPGGNFLTDTFWPAIIGEAGFLGLIAFCGGLVSMFAFARRMGRSKDLTTAFLGLVGVGWSIEFAIESAASPVYTGPPSFPLLFSVVGVLASIASIDNDGS